MTAVYVTDSKPRYLPTLVLQIGHVLCIRNGILVLMPLSAYRRDHITNGRKLCTI